ncbi:MAG: RES family NAD+ phosphorylase [Gammaproteobacteria bacterium]|nr:RES family NAD+ phosphorylase [Gammaproteobacteria bacterium]
MPLPLRAVEWTKTYRIVPSVYPPVNLFDRVADLNDLDAVIAVEGLTNNRLRDEIGEIALVPKEDRVSGAGTGPIMAAFTHINRYGSRFSDGSYGVYYTADSVTTAIMETKYHRERFFRYSNEPAIHVHMRLYISAFNNELHDLRGLKQDYPAVYHISDYTHSQPLGRKLRSNDSLGIVYESIRHESGYCAAIFKPRVLKPVIQGAHYTYCWDGNAIRHIFEVGGNKIELPGESKHEFS